MSDIILLNGGTGMELIARCKGEPTPLWSARVMLDEPDLLEQVHRDYIAAGATVLTLNTYSATPERLARDGIGDAFDAMQAQALDIAHAAIGETDTALAGCLPPLVGSYRPDIAPDPATSAASYARIVAAEKDRVDLFLCETLSSASEARIATTAAKASGKTVWCALSVDDADGSKLRSGEPVQAGIDAALDAGADAILINCSRPEAVSAAMPALAAAGVPFGGYANGFVHAAELVPGTTVAGMAVRTDLGPQAYAGFAMSWVDIGATIIGGCCEVGPAHIAHLADRLRGAGHAIVRPR